MFIIHYSAARRELNSNNAYALATNPMKIETLINRFDLIY